MVVIAPAHSGGATIHTMLTRVACWAFVLSAGSVLLAEPPAAWHDGPTTLLERTLGLTPAEREKVDHGAPVVRVLRPSAAHEVALAGGIRVTATAREFIALAGDIPRWKRGPAVLQLGRFGKVPSLDDVASLRLDEPDLAALRRCAGRPCDVKLAALAAEQFRNFDWQAPDPVGRAEAIVRAAVVRHATQYLADGDRSLMVYAPRRTVLADEMRGLLREASSLDEYAPGLRTYLEEFPHAALPGVESAIYWARESFGLKPVLSLYHVVVLPSSREGTSVLVSKQFYASRYFDASLDVVVAVDGGAGGEPHCYVAQIARARTDSLRGMAGSLKRSAVTREAEQSLAKLLRRFAGLVEPRGTDVAR